MDKQAKKQERSFELRSEKVRSIVGQIPSSLVRYGITAIHRVTTATPADSTDITILLKFENKRPEDTKGQMIYLQSPYRTIAGQIQDLSSVRDTLERQKALCRFKSADIKTVENQTVDFQITRTSGNLLQKMLGDI